jgi:Nucleotidyl transferase AbiEii toxin, Type IV TA system
MSTSAYKQIIAAAPRDRLELFLATANRLGAPVGNVEKDFWVCWTLNALYHERPAGGPRLLFKGGTSLSKAYGLIQRFSEDIDITLFRDDLDQAASVEELEALSNKKRKGKLDAIRDACSDYITGPLRNFLIEQLADATGTTGSVDIDEADADGQTLLVWYPEVEPNDAAYVRPVVRIESGAKSALDPNRRVKIRPYISEEVAALDLTISDVTAIEAARTFWDKVVIAHGLRRWYERRGVLRQEGQRVSRHYYDLHCLLASEAGGAALADRDLGADCVRHARMFFDRPDYDLLQPSPAHSRSCPSALWLTRSATTMPVQRP